MPSSPSLVLVLCGIAFILASLVTLGVVLAVLGTVFELYLFYKGGVT